MKRLYIISLLFCCTLLFGCKRDSVVEPEEQIVSNVVITMNVYNNNASTRAESATAMQDGIMVVRSI